MTSWLHSLFGSGRERRVREPEFAGVQYPSEADELRATVDELLEGASSRGAARSDRGVVAPYGDYAYAGPVMADAYASAPTSVERVVVVGSSARVPFRGVAVAPWDALATPLGEIEIDDETMSQLVDEELARPIEAAFEPAASLELQLPFLQVVFDDVVGVPLLVGDGSVEEVEEVLDRVCDPQTWLVVAANLSEGFPSEEAESYDEATVRAVESGEEGQIERDRTTARLPLQALVRLARQRGWGVDCQRRTSSGETAGRGDRVVGYAAFRIVEAD